MTKPLTLLVVDDEFSERVPLKELGESLDFVVITAIGGSDAWTKLDEDPEITAIITDVRMPGVDGLMVLQYIDRRDTQPKTLVHSSEKTYRPRGGEECNLADWVSTYFGEFASFAKKTRGLDAERAFLEEILVARQ